MTEGWEQGDDVLASGFVKGQAEEHLSRNLKVGNHGWTRINTDGK